MSDQGLDDVFRDTQLRAMILDSIQYRGRNVISQDILNLGRNLLAGVEPVLYLDRLIESRNLLLTGWVNTDCECSLLDDHVQGLLKQVNVLSGLIKEKRRLVYRAQSRRPSEIEIILTSSAEEPTSFSY